MVSTENVSPQDCGGGEWLGDDISGYISTHTPRIKRKTIDSVEQK